MADLTSTAALKAALAAPVREPKRPAADMKTDELRRAASAYEAFYLS
jgi:predicted methyltransferase